MKNFAAHADRHLKSNIIGGSHLPKKYGVPYRSLGQPSNRGTDTIARAFANVSSSGMPWTRPLSRSAMRR